MERFPELSEAMSSLSWAHPFWSTLIYDRLTLKVTDAIPTAATDGKYIFVNEAYFTGECDALERIFALAHETCHAMLDHPRRWQEYITFGFDGAPFDLQRANIAADLIVNAMLVHTKVGKIKHHTPPQPGDWLLSPNVQWTDSFEDVYRRLTPPPSPPPPPSGGSAGDPSDGQGGGQGDPQQGQGTPQAGPEGGTQLPQGGGAGSWEVAPHPERGGRPHQLHQPRSQDTHIANDGGPSELEWKQSIEAAAIGAKAVGNMHADLARFITDYITPKRDWKQTLRDFFVRSRGRDRRDWRRSNKRKMHTMRIFVPKRHSWKVGNVLIIDDYSGSISNEEKRLYRGAMSAILTDCKPKCLRALAVTTQVCDDQILKTPAELEQWQPRGSGGTDMEAGFRHVLEDGWIPDVAVVLTDGYTPFTDPPPFPVIWVSTGLAPEEYPYGSAVMMEE